MKPSTLIRFMLTIFLLVEVFTHAHWSVGVCFALIFIGFESFGYMIGKFVDAVKAQRQQEQAALALLQGLRKYGNKTDQSN